MPRPEKFGSVIGTAPGGVLAYSSHYESADDDEYPTRRSYIGNVDGIYTGYKYQCVEFARRWLIQTQGITFEDVGMAYEILDLPSFARVSRGGKDGNAPVPIVRAMNGAPNVHMPELGTVLLWNPSGFFRHTGHVAIVTHVGDRVLGVAEQNVTDAKWQEGKNHAREIVWSRDPATGSIVVEDPHWRNTTVRGWVTVRGPHHHQRSASSSAAL